MAAGIAVGVVRVEGLGTVALRVVRWGTVPNSACAVYEAESVARRLNWCWQGETTAGNLEATRREHTSKARAYSGGQCVYRAVQCSTEGAPKDNSACGRGTGKRA